MTPVVPDNVTQAMDEVRKAWNQLMLHGPANRAQRTPGPMNQLGLIAERQKNLHNALERLIKANT